MEAVTIIEVLLAVILVSILTWGTARLKKALLRYCDQIRTPQQGPEELEWT